MHVGSVECSSCDKSCLEGSSRNVPNSVSCLQVCPHHLALRIEPRYQQSRLGIGPFHPFHAAESPRLPNYCTEHRILVLGLLVSVCADSDNPPAAYPLHEACISSSELPSHFSSIPCYLLANASAAVRQCGPDTWHKLFSMGRTSREVFTLVLEMRRRGVPIPGLALAPASYEHRTELAIQAIRERYDLTWIKPYHVRFYTSFRSAALPAKPATLCHAPSHGRPVTEADHVDPREGGSWRRSRAAEPERFSGFIPTILSWATAQQGRSTGAQGAHGRTSSLSGYLLELRWKHVRR